MIGLKEVNCVLAMFSLVVSSCGGSDSPGALAGCQDCSIERVLVATITDSSFAGGALIEPGAATVFATADTGFIVLAGVNSAEVFFAGRSGEIERQIGIAGEGPGEYQRAVAVMETGSEYLILDDRLGRVTHLSKSEFEFVDAVSAPVFAGTFSGAFPTAFRDGSIAMSARRRTADAAGQPIHIVGQDGQVLSSFGTSDTLTSRFVAAPAGIAISGDTAVWVADSDRYRIRLWGRTGNLLAEIERQVEWFPWPEPEPAAGQLRARLQSIFEDEEGRLWVLLSTRRRIEQLRTIERGGETFQETRLVLDPDPSQSRMIVEVIDPTSASVIASAEFAGVRAYAMPGGRYHVSAGSTENGLPLIHVWGFELR